MPNFLLAEYHLRHSPNDDHQQHHQSQAIEDTPPSFKVCNSMDLVIDHNSTFPPSTTSTLEVSMSDNKLESSSLNDLKVNAEGEVATTPETTPKSVAAQTFLRTRIKFDSLLFGNFVLQIFVWNLVRCHWSDHSHKIRETSFGSNDNFEFISHYFWNISIHLFNVCGGIFEKSSSHSIVQYGSFVLFSINLNHNYFGSIHRRYYNSSRILDAMDYLPNFCFYRI